MRRVFWHMDRKPAYGDLAMAGLEGMARVVRECLEGRRVAGPELQETTEEIVWSLAGFFTEDTIAVGESSYKPRLAFLDGASLPVLPTRVALKDYVNGMVEQAFNDDPEHGYPINAG